MVGTELPADGKGSHAYASHATWAMAVAMSCLWLASQHFHEQTKAELRASMKEELQFEEELQQWRMATQSELHELSTAHERLLGLVQEEAKKNSTNAHEVVPAAVAQAPAVERRLQTQCDCWDSWRISGDGCNVDETNPHCIVSQNYPSPYPANSGCSIEIVQEPNYWIQIEDYKVEWYWDFFTIDDVQYRFTDPPRTFKPNGGIFMVWAADVSVQRRGWKFCRRSTCDYYTCPAGYTSKPNPELIICATDECDVQDLGTCCDRTCGAPDSLDAEYSVQDTCTVGPNYTVSDCPISCASGYALDGNSAPQKCLDDGTFGLPTCVASDSTAFPWVVDGHCQQYGASCVSSLGVGGRYGAEERCLMTIDHANLPYEASRYQLSVTYMDTEQNDDQLIFGVELEPTSCDDGGWTCHHPDNGTNTPTYGWPNSARKVSGTKSSPQGPYSLANVAWTSDSVTMGTGWVLCAQTTCVAMSCPAGYRFNCASEESWCLSHDCSLSADVDICCLPESVEDGHINGYVPGQAHNVSWCWAGTTTTTTTTTTTWGAKPDIVGHLILTLTAIDPVAGDTRTREEIMREVVHSALMNLGRSLQWDVQVGLNISNDTEPTSHVAFRVEQTDELLVELPDEDFIAAFNNGTNYVQAISYRVMKSILTTLRGDPDGNHRSYGSGCQALHPCSELNNWGSCWQEDYSWMTCGYITDNDVCGPNLTPGPGWHAHFPNPTITYENWATNLAVANPSWGPQSVLGECCACGGGRCSNGFFRIFNDVPTFCIPCQPGSSSVSADDPRECVECGPGTYAGVLGSPECSACPAGRFTDEQATTECGLCPAGTVASQEGATACDACPPGTAPSPDHAECVPCAIGRFAGFNATPECEPCPAGQFTAEVGVSACTLCDVGMFTGSTGRTDCDPCSPGSFSDAMGVSACYDCPTGQAQALPQQTSCEECEPGYSARVPGLSECLLCEAGFESSESGAAECTPCQPGFAKPYGEMNCSACDAGTYTSEPGRSACRTCPNLGQITNALEAADGCVDCTAGRYAPAKGLTVCIDCSLGFYGNEERMSACVQCAAGTSANQTGLTECPQCKPGTFAPVEGQFLCDKCAPGLHTPSFGSIECTACQAGTKAPAEGTAVCTLCDAGAFSPLPGQTACEICQPGRFAEADGKAECTFCEPGNFGEQEGMTRCIGCSEVRPGEASFWTTMRPPTDTDPTRASSIKPWIELRGASSNSSCGCRPGTQPRDGICEECGEGMICLGMGVLEIAEGYAWDGEYSAWNCEHGIEEACPGGVPGTCMPGRDVTSVACAACLPDMVDAEDGSCAECGGGDLALPIIAAIMAVAITTAVYCLFDSPKQKRPKLSYLLIIASLGQAITIIQQLGIISLIRVDWADPLLSVFELVGNVAFFDLQDIRAGCVANFDIPRQYLLRVVTVFIGLLVVGLAHTVSQLLQHRHDWRTRWPSLWCALGTILLACMVSVVSTMLSPMQCRKHPNGRQTVSWYPSITCWEGGDHSQMVVLGSVACLLPVCFLTASFWAVWRYPKRLMQAKTTFLNSWAFLFFRYSPEAYWYGPVMMVRNCLVAAAPVMTSPVLQIVALQVVMLLSLVLLLYVMPWRVPRANDLDAIGHLCLLVVTMLAAFFAGKEDLNFISILAVICICVLPVFLVALLGYGMFTVILASFRKFQFFLCHHKQGAGCFCRLLKMWLLRTSGVKRKVFIDSDDLKNLDKLFDVVAHQTETLVAVNSQNLLQRPWCVGEITTAHRGRVRIMPLYVSGVAPPTEEFITNFLTYVPDVSSITQFGIDLEMVHEALQWFAKANHCMLPQEITDKTLESLCTGLVSAKLPEQLPSDQSKTTVLPEVVIIANKMDFEAAATAMILRNLLNPLIQHQDNSLSYVLGMSDIVSPTVKRGMLICTNGVFTEHVLGALLACKVRSAVVLPIMSVTNFIIPSSSWMEKQEAFGKVPEARQIVKAVFSEIAVDFQPSALSGTEATLQTKAAEIAGRLNGNIASLTDKVSELGKRSKGRTHTSTHDSGTQIMHITTTQSESPVGSGSPTASGQPSPDKTPNISPIGSLKETAGLKEHPYTMRSGSAVSTSATASQEPGGRGNTYGRVNTSSSTAGQRPSHQVGTIANLRTESMATEATTGTHEGTQGLEIIDADWELGAQPQGGFDEMML